MNDIFFKNKIILFAIFITFYPIKILAQTENSSTLTNSAAPSASAVTSGGTSINYQTNNAYNNEQGFGGGIFCRTPTIYFGGTFGGSEQDTFDTVQSSGTITDSFTINAGILYPFGSRIIDYCKRLANSITSDREVSSEISMLKACNDLEEQGIVINEKIIDTLPRLKPCFDIGSLKTIKVNQDIKKQLAPLIPKTIRSL